jgi:FtsP/CotA-like multicopper oxidase with cupredoxin domain
MLARGASATNEIRLRAEPASARLSGDEGPKTDTLNYAGGLQDNILRLKQGEPVRLIVENGLDKDTTVHWHGIRLANAMDGVPGLTQTPIKSGETFLYEFTPPDAGTFWFHPHANSLEEIGRGLAAALIVEEHNPPAVDRDVLWLLQDWRLDKSGELSKLFGSAMDAMMSGRVGNIVTINRAKPKDFVVKAGERIRLRLANGCVARMMALSFAGHSPVIIALDGQPCEPHEPENSRIVLGPAMRADIILDMAGAPGQSYAVTDDFYDGLAYTLSTITYEAGAPPRDHPLDGSLRLPVNPLSEPDMASALRQEIILQGGMMGGGKLKGLGGMPGMNMSGMGNGPSWAINGMSMTGDGSSDMVPAFTLQRGQTCYLTLRNQTAWWHPMHIHGFSMKVLTRNGVPVPHAQWQDTVLLAPADILECVFVADNPGHWMLHCHVIDHSMAGLMTVFRVT